ncbi:hypothetical protein [Chitinophaga agrisoli]|nr:hypothetical protein [Chitinophaga agrisoli]
MKYKDDETWSYGNGVVTFKAGVVISYKNIDGNLHVREEQTPTQPQY